MQHLLERNCFHINACSIERIQQSAIHQSDYKFMILPSEGSYISSSRLFSDAWSPLITTWNSYWDQSLLQMTLHSLIYNFLHVAFQNKAGCFLSQEAHGVDHLKIRNEFRRTKRFSLWTWRKLKLKLYLLQFSHFLLKVHPGRVLFLPSITHTQKVWE